MALFEVEPIQDLGETNEALKFRLGRLIAETASKHDPELQSLIDEAIEVLGSNPLSDSKKALRDFESFPLEAAAPSERQIVTDDAGAIDLKGAPVTRELP